MDLNRTTAERWASKFYDALRDRGNVRELTKDEMRDLVLILMYPDALNNSKLIKELEAKKHGLSSLLWLRIRYCHDYKITPAACVFLASIISTPAQATMIANYLQYVAYRNGKREISGQDICEFAFPCGIPTEDLWLRMWDLQKLDHPEMHKISDNALDYSFCTESISIKGVQK